VSYKDFHAQFNGAGDDTWKAYLLSGGSPMRRWRFGSESEYEYFFEIIRDWISARSSEADGRDVPAALMRTLFARLAHERVLKLRARSVSLTILLPQSTSNSCRICLQSSLVSMDADKVCRSAQAAKFSFRQFMRRARVYPDRMTQISESTHCRPGEAK